jgi:hypothetical protein
MADFGTGLFRCESVAAAIIFRVAGLIEVVSSMRAWLIAERRNMNQGFVQGEKAPFSEPEA